MKVSKVIQGVFILYVLGFMSLTEDHAKGHMITKHERTSKPPDAIQGGKWSDDFWIGQLEDSENIDVQVSHLFLKYKEQLHWTQTWTYHFTSGEFWHTEAISDAVRLAWNEAEQDYFTTGIYTSTVFNAGRPVDWATSVWWYSGIPDGVLMELRTGNAPLPDETWTSWRVPDRVMMEDYCAYTVNVDETECYSSMHGIASSQYIQYRSSFTSNDPIKTIAVNEIDFLYGIHDLSGHAVTIPISPVDLREWESVLITSTAPANTTLIIDILGPDGSVLIPDVSNGISLKGIDPHAYPTLQLRASLTTRDESISPDVDLWGLRWLVMNRLFLPVLLR